MSTVLCPKCQTPFDPKGKWGVKKFCSKSCANSRIQTEEQNRRRRAKALISPSGAVVNPEARRRGGITRGNQRKKPILTHICSECGITFTDIIQRKYCSKKCSSLNTYHPNSTRRNSSVHKGYRMDSSSELKFAQLLDIHGVKWIKNSSTFFSFIDSRGNKRKYYPDFFLPDYNLWVEIKGRFYIREDDNIRLAAVGRIELIYSDDIRLPSAVVSSRKD